LRDNHIVVNHRAVATFEATEAAASVLLSEGEKYVNEKGRTGCRQGRGEDETGGEGSEGDPPYVSLNFP